MLFSSTKKENNEKIGKKKKIEMCFLYNNYEKNVIHFTSESSNFLSFFLQFQIEINKVSIEIKIKNKINLID